MKIGLFGRIFLAVVGLLIATFTLVYGLPEDVGIGIYIAGYDITVYAVAVVILLISFFGMSLFRTGLTGKKDMD